MSIKYKILPGFKLCIDKYDDKVNLKDVKEFVIKQHKDKQYLEVELLLVDFSLLTEPLSVEDIQEIIKINKPGEFIKNIKRIALWVTTPEGYVSNYFFMEEIASKMNVKIGIYSTLKGALAYLGLNNEYERIKTMLNEFY